MKLGIHEECVAAKKRIAAGTADNRDHVMIALLDSTGSALISAAEHLKNLEVANVQVRNLVRNADIMATKLARYVGNDLVVKI